MKFQIKKEELFEPLDIVTRIVSSNNTLPILDNVLIELSSEEKKITLTCTNLEIAIRVEREANVSKDGRFTLPAKILLSYIGLLKDKSKINFEIKEGNLCVIESEEGTTEMKALDPENFPIVPQVSDSADKFVIPHEEFIQGINLTSFSVSSNNIRPTLSGVFIYTEGEDLIFASTDIYRLSEYRAKKTKDISGFKIIVPARTLHEYARIFPKAKERVECFVDKNQVVFKGPQTTLISRIIEGKFPDYKKIIPEKAAVKIDIDKEEFQRALKRVSLFAKEQNYNVKIFAKGAEQSLVVISENSQMGRQEARIPCKIKGEDTEIALNSQYILDFLQVLYKNSLEIEATSKLTAVLFRPQNDESFTHLIMPLKLD